MALEFRKTTDYRPVWLRVFLYGASRSGKTTAAASFPSLLQVCPPHEDSWKALSGREGIIYVEVGKDDPLKIMSDMNDLIEQITVCYRTGGKTEEERVARLHAEIGQTLCVESLSHYCDAVVSALTNGGKVQPSQQTWGMLLRHLLSIRDRLFALPMHIIFTSLAKVTTDESGKVTSAGPRITGAAAELLPSSCDMIGYCEQTAHMPPQFMTHFRTWDRYPGGSRLMAPTSLRSGDGVNTPSLFQQLLPLLPQYQQAG